MKSFVGIVAEAEKENAETIAREVKNFRVRIYDNRLQAVVTTVGYFLLRNLNGLGWLRSRLRRKNEVWLAIVRKYKLMVQEAYGLVEVFFNRWEDENRRNGCGSVASARGESDAKRLVESLTRDAQKELVEAHYPFAVLRCDLIYTHNGHITAQKGMKYWDGLEKFFADRVQDLRE